MNRKISNKQIKEASLAIGCSVYTVRKMIDVEGLKRDKGGAFLPEDIEFNRMVWEYLHLIRQRD